MLVELESKIVIVGPCVTDRPIIQIPEKLYQDAKTLVHLFKDIGVEPTRYAVLVVKALREIGQTDLAHAKAAFDVAIKNL